MQKTKAPRRSIPPGWLNTEQVAVRLDRGVSAVEKMVIDGRLPPPYQFGNRCVLFSKAEIDEFLAQQNAGSVEPAAASRKTA